MSREELVPQLQTRGTQVHRLKYSKESVSVYQCTSKGFPSAVKVISLALGADYTQLEKECQILQTLVHPNILRLYDYFWVNKGVNNYFVIVTEWCEKDLAKDMQQRAAFKDRWGEEQLWNLTFELVSALTYMQEQGISHRDIKPENIFLTSSKSAKLGDFGSARSFLSDIGTATLTGTPLFLSPKQREALANNQTKVIHNSFKSDVFSLGLTLFSLASLGPPLTLARGNLTDEEVQTEINSVPYSHLFKSMLIWMLSVDEDNRCDFKTLNAWLENTHPRHKPISCQVVCMYCGQLVDRYRETALCEVVQLYCDPSNHLFCCNDCCKAYLSLGKFKCPLCGVGIPNETVIFYLTIESPEPAQFGNGETARRINSEERKKSAEENEVKLPIDGKADERVPGTTDDRKKSKTEISKLRRRKKDTISSANCCSGSCSCW